MPTSYWLLVEKRMEELRLGLSDYIQKLVREDTQQIWEQTKNPIPFPEPLAKVAEDSPEYGSERNDPAPPARRSEVSYTPKKTRGK